MKRIASAVALNIFTITITILFSSSSYCGLKELSWLERRVLPTHQVFNACPLFSAFIVSALEYNSSYKMNDEWAKNCQLF